MTAVMIKAINIALTGLDAASKKLNASASNIANISTSGSLGDNGPAPYTPQTTTQKTTEVGGVTTTTIDRKNPFTPAFDPDSPFADENGIIGIPNVNLAEEGVNTVSAKNEYKANLQVIKAASELNEELLRLFDDEA